MYGVVIRFTSKKSSSASSDLIPHLMITSMANYTSTPYHSSINHASAYDGIPGAVLLDGILQSFLLGFVIGQASKYFSAFKDDRWQKRTFVGVVVLLSLLQTIIEEYKLWQISVNKSSWVSQRGDLDASLGLISRQTGSQSLCMDRRGYQWMYQLVVRDLLHPTMLEDHNPWVLYPLGTLSVTVFIANLIQAVSLPLVVNKTDPESGTKESNLVLFFVLLAGKLYSYGLLRTLNSRDGFRLRLNSHNLGRATLSNWQWDQGRGDDHPHLETAVASISEVSAYVFARQITVVAN
ncbi:hypothetical protein HHX47_DHR5001023 [Lentinula edodes]|nr:hypothetical protein HHX47_DHR5001023 [Lentinula edodes]